MRQEQQCISERLLHGSWSAAEALGQECGDFHWPRHFSHPRRVRLSPKQTPLPPVSTARKKKTLLLTSCYQAWANGQPFHYFIIVINGLPNEVIVRYPKANWSLLGQCHQVMVNVPGSMKRIESHKPWGGRVSRRCLWRLFLGKVALEKPRGAGSVNVVMGDVEARRGRGTTATCP